MLDCSCFSHGLVLYTSNMLLLYSKGDLNFDLIKKKEKKPY